MFGVTYLVPAMMGGVIGSIDKGDCDCHDANRMFIPIVGPLTLLHSDSDYNPLNALLIMTTVLQSVGALMTVLGIIRYAESAEDDDYEMGRLTRSLRIVAAPVPGGAYAGLNLRL